MGICVSSRKLSYEALGRGGGAPAAIVIVILMDGTYYQFSRAVKAEQILRECPGHFICNSDGLYIGQKMREHLPWQELEIGQIYFLLPRRKLEFVVSGSDMACLLYKANSALKQSCPKYQVGDYIRPSFYINSQIEERSEKKKLRSEQLPSSSQGRNTSKSSRSQFGSPRKQWTTKLDTIVEVS